MSTDLTVQLTQQDVVIATLPTGRVCRGGGQLLHRRLD